MKKAVKQASDNIEMDIVFYQNLQELVDKGLYPQDTIYKTANEIESKKLLLETVVKDFIKQLMEEHTKIMKLKINQLLEGIGCPQDGKQFVVYVPSKIAPELDKVYGLEYELKYELGIDVKFNKL